MKKQLHTRKAHRVNPEWTGEMIASARPAKEVLPRIFGARAAAAMLKPRGRAKLPEKLGVIRGSGSVYRDFDVPDADVRQLKAILAAEIIKALDKTGLSVRKAQSMTGIDAGDFSRIRNADFRRISVERLMAVINGLGARIEVAVKVRRSSIDRQSAE